MMHAWNGAAGEWAAAMVRASLQGGAAILAVWAVGRLLPRLAPWVRCWLWRLAYLKLAVALLWAAPLELPLLPAGGAPPTLAERGSGPVTPATRDFSPDDGDLAATAQGRAAAGTFTADGSLLVLWLLGVGWCAVRLVRAWGEVRGLCRNAVPLEDDEVTDVCAALSERLGLRRVPELRVGEGLSGPLVMGVWRPVVLLPPGVLKGSREELRLLLAHELSHVRRGDLGWNWLGALAQGLFFFHPLVWLAHSEARLAQESACDALALQVTGAEPDRYGRMLVKVAADHARHAQPQFAAVGAVESYRTLKRRIQTMAHFAPMSRGRLALAGAALAAAGLVSIVPLRVVAQDAATPGKIVYSTTQDDDMEIYAMNPDGTGKTRLTNEAEYDWWPVLSPDGKKIAWVKQRGENDENEIWLMNADGTGAQQLTDRAGLDTTPFWSPDGKRLCFVTDRDGNWEIYAMDADGTNPVNLTNNGATDSNPAWSPDGKKILFTSTRDGNAEIYVMNSDGTNPDNLTNNLPGGAPDHAGIDSLPAWSPDGKQIAFMSDRAGHKDIWLMNADGTNPVAITNDEARDGMPRFSPDGKRLIFHSNRTGNPNDFDVYTVKLDGTDVQNLTNNPAFDQMPHWVK